MKTISKKDAKIMLKGASILSCGGGLPYKEQLDYLNTLSFDKNIEVLDINELNQVPKDKIFITASELGPACDPPINKSKMTEMIDLFSKKYQKKIAGIIPVEIGQESIIFDAALHSNLPIVNTDLAGFRAVPKANFNALVMQRVNFTRSPLIVLTNSGTIIAMDKNISLNDDEIKLRQIAKDTKGVIFVIGSFITASIIKKYLNYPSLTTIYNVGKSLEEKKDFTKKIPLSIKYQAEGKIIDIYHKNSLGFSEKEVIIKINNNIFTLKVKNEYLKFSNRNIVFEFPQLITIYSKSLNRGLSSLDLVKGIDIEVIIFNPLPFWDNFKSIYGKYS